MQWAVCRFLIHVTYNMITMKEKIKRERKNYREPKQITHIPKNEKNVIHILEKLVKRQLLIVDKSYFDFANVRYKTYSPKKFRSNQQSQRFAIPPPKNLRNF